MSWEPAAPRLAPLVIGLLLGLFAMAATPLVYYWLFAPAYAAVLGGVVVLLSVRFRRLVPVAEGMFAAALFGVVFVAVAYAGLSTLVR
ncbi:hypothetical protein EV580_0683 [Mycobacterium sp. BK086]|uniref:hypothetical protein n=1 Tax=Mycobacterium sp. BK086 TaxID=2512165 RepID=UPI00105D94D8|nr:hypothetical protein [Mycobacterium sp. BK086]TDO17510.1 hypothetical protein EV580_0683 [Mycobacterium sp. BK086]